MWADGQEMPDGAQSLAQALGDLADLDWERDVLKLYETEEKEIDDAEETQEGA